MLTGSNRIILFDTESVQDPSTGDREKRVTRAKVLAAVVDLVGIATAQVGQVQGYQLTHSVPVKRIMYDKEKYLYFGETLYEVKTMSKAKLSVDMLLNVQESNDSAAKSAVERWIDENL